MNTCLNYTMCGEKQHYYMQWCNYNYNGYEYTPHPTKTCRRPNITNVYSSCSTCWRFMDCCADKIEECCIPSETALPTSFPTAMPTRMCGLGDNYYYEKNKEGCIFFEEPKDGIAYNTEHSLVCCKDDRNECCVVKNEYYYSTIVSLSLVISIFMFVCIRELQLKRRRIEPE